MHRVLACDLDGVIFDFNTPYINWLNHKFKSQIPQPSADYPDTWYYVTDGGHVTKEQEGQFWKWAAGEGNYQFWRFLPAYPGAKEFLAGAFDRYSDIYFVTARPGKDAKKASEHALETLGVNRPQVVIASEKVPTLIGIGATDFIDDRDVNFEDVLLWGMGQGDVHMNDPKIARNLKGSMNGMDLGINLWMLDRPWNRHYSHPRVTRITDPKEIL